MGASVGDGIIVEQELQDLSGLLDDLLCRVSSANPTQAQHIARMLRITAVSFDLVSQGEFGHLTVRQQERPA